MSKEEQLYEVVAEDGTIMPPHYSGRRRTYDEAKLMVDRLNKNGEFSPYTMIKV